MITKLKQLYALETIQKILLIYLCLQPVIDIGTSLLVRGGVNLTFGVVLRAIFLLFMGVYLLFFYKGPKKKLIVAYIAALCAYVLLQFGLLLAGGGAGALFTNLKETVKVFYFPCVLLAFWALYRQYGYLMPDKPLVRIAVFYTLTIFISFVTNTSFQSYTGNGYCGWFYAANEISAITIILSPLVFYHYTSRDAFEAVRTGGGKQRGLTIAAGAASVLLMLFASVYLATKAALLGVAAYLLCFFVWSVFRLEITRDKLYLFRMVAAVVMIALLAGLYLAASPVKKHLTERMTWFHHVQVEQTTVPTTVDTNQTTAPPPIHDTHAYRVANWLLSSRLSNSRSVLFQYLESGPAYKLLGIGYANLPGYEYNAEIAVEMDFISVFYRHGVVGLFLFAAPFFALLATAIKRSFRSLKACLASLTWCTCLYQVMIGFAVGFLTGHTFVAPAVSIYVIFMTVKLLAVSERLTAAPSGGESKR